MQSSSPALPISSSWERTLCSGERLSLETLDPTLDLFAPAMRAVNESLVSRQLPLNGIKRTSVNLAPKMQLDRSRMLQVVFNLLENAIKYASPDPNTFRVLVSYRKTDSGFEFSFRDWGIGVTEGYESRIFLMGVRAPNSLDQLDVTGRGIGLPIARNILRAHGGDLTYQRHEKGSEFIAFLPRSVASLE